MTITYPTTIDSPTNPSPSNPRNSPSLAGLITDLQTAVVALETKVGANSSAVAASVDFKLSGVSTAGSDKAASLAGTENLSNKTLTAPKVNIGSDATGDIYYRDAGGLFQRLPIGAASTILSVDPTNTIPSWIPNPSASNASTSVKGVGQIATTADITAGTSLGTTGAILLVPASAVGSPGANKLVQYNSSGQYPAADGSLITGLTGGYTGAITTGSSSTNQNVDTVFTCGFQPSIIAIAFKMDGQVNGGGTVNSQGISYFNGTTFVNTFWDYTDSVGPTLSASTRVFNTNTPTVPQGAPSGTPTIKVTLSVLSVSSTGFTIRAAYTGAAGSITGHVSYFPIANK